MGRALGLGSTSSTSPTGTTTNGQGVTGWGGGIPRRPPQGNGSPPVPNMGRWRKTRGLLCPSCPGGMRTEELDTVPTTEASFPTLAKHMEHHSDLPLTPHAFLLY